MMTETKNPITTPWTPAKNNPREAANRDSNKLINNFLMLSLVKKLFTASVKPSVSVTISPIKRLVDPQFGHFSPGPVLMNCPHCWHLIIFLFSHLTLFIWIYANIASTANLRHTTDILNILRP